MFDSCSPRSHPETDWPIVVTAATLPESFRSCIIFDEIGEHATAVYGVCVCVCGEGGDRPLITPTIASAILSRKLRRFRSYNYYTGGPSTGWFPAPDRPRHRSDGAARFEGRLFDVRSRSLDAREPSFPLLAENGTEKIPTNDSRSLSERETTSL